MSRRAPARARLASAANDLPAINTNAAARRLSVLRLGLQAGSVFWTVFYFLFIPICVFHAMNGIWGIIADYRPSDRLAVFLQAVFVLIGLALVYFGVITMYNLLQIGTGGANVG